MFLVYQSQYVKFMHVSVSLFSNCFSLTSPHLCHCLDCLQLCLVTLLLPILVYPSVALPLVSLSVPVILSCRILSSCDLWFQFCVAFFGYCFVLCVLFATSLIKRLPFRESCLPPASKFYILYILLQIVCIQLSIS